MCIMYIHVHLATSRRPVEMKSGSREAQEGLVKEMVQWDCMTKKVREEADEI